MFASLSFSQSANIPQGTVHQYANKTAQNTVRDRYDCSAQGQTASVTDSQRSGSLANARTHSTYTPRIGVYAPTPVQKTP